MLMIWHDVYLLLSFLVNFFHVRGGGIVIIMFLDDLLSYKFLCLKLLINFGALFILKWDLRRCGVKSLRFVVIVKICKTLNIISSGIPGKICVWCILCDTRLSALASCHGGNLCLEISFGMKRFIAQEIFGQPNWRGMNYNLIAELSCVDVHSLSCAWKINAWILP